MPEMHPQLYALPDGRHIAVGSHASIRELDAVQAHVGQFEHAVVLDRGEVDDHHAHVERELRDALKRIAALEAERAGLHVMWAFRYGDGEFATKERALQVAAEHGCADEGDAAVCWRLVGQWQDASSPDAESEA